MQSGAKTVGSPVTRGGGYLRRGISANCFLTVFYEREAVCAIKNQGEYSKP